jgi:hypothetical protein
VPECVTLQTHLVGKNTHDRGSRARTTTEYRYLAHNMRRLATPHHEVPPRQMHVRPAQVGTLLGAQPGMRAQQNQHRVHGITRRLQERRHLVIGVGHTLVPGWRPVVGHPALREGVDGDDMVTTRHQRSLA